MLRMWILEAVTTRIFADVPASAARAYFAVWSRPLGSIRMHSDQVPVPRETLRRSVRVLVEAGWVYPMHVDGKDVIVPWMPVDVEASISARLMSVREDIKHYGEWLLRCMLDLMVLDGDYIDNARPSWLVTSNLEGKLELDRLYRSAGVAFEFQGRQHSEITPFTPSEADLAEQMRRDRIKAQICEEEGIRLITVDARELSFATLRTKIGSSLPLMPVMKDRPLFQSLRRMARGYCFAISRSSPKA